MRHLVAAWRRTAMDKPPYPRLPPGWRSTGPSLRSHFFHYSTTGQIPGPLVHIGGRSAAFDRARSLEQVNWSEVDVDRMIADGNYWKPTLTSAIFLVNLTVPVINEGEWISDDQSNDVQYVMDRTRQAGALRYRNRYEHDPAGSVVAPVQGIEVVGIYSGNNYYFPSPVPGTQARQRLVDHVVEYRRFRRAQSLWDQWLDSEYEDEDDEEMWFA